MATNKLDSIKAKYFYPYRNFISIDDKYSNFEDSKFLILPIPYDSTTSFKSGTREGPIQIISSSGFIELYDHELNAEPYKLGIHTLPELMPFPGNSQDMMEHIYKATKDLLKFKKTIISIGGDHSVSIGLIKAHSQVFKDLSVLQFDAHSDLRDKYEGTSIGSPTVMKRAVEMGVKLSQVGLRAVSPDEVKFAKKNNITQIYAEQMQDNKSWIEEVITSLNENVYISFDVDFFDSSIMPATGTPEPGGPNWYDAIHLLKEVAKHKNIIGVDVVEYSPSLGPDACAFTVAKLIYKIIGYITAKS